MIEDRPNAKVIGSTPNDDDTAFDVSGWSADRIEAELVGFASLESRALYRSLRLLVEFDRRQLWGSWMCRSVMQWLSMKCGLSLSAGGERLRVGYALESLPEISRRFAAGRISYSKVRAVTRVATPASDEQWADLAENGTAAQLDRLVWAKRRVSRQEVCDQNAIRGAGWTTNADGSVTLTLTLPADEAVEVKAVVEAAISPDKGRPRTQSRADAVVGLLTGGRTPAGEVLVHVDGNGAHSESGTALHPGLAEMFSCDHPVTTVEHSPDGPRVSRRDPAPSKAQRRLLGIRHRTCQFPGCHHAGDFDAHHVVERRRGGPTRLWNLARLCRFHHRMIHLWGLVVTLHPDRRLTVAWPDGTPVDRELDPQRCRVELEAVEDPDRIGGLWDGSRLHIDDCLAGFVPD
ncbi:MAG: DUF222 domain-containing protein [Ilumatobacteraceae bacterium]